MKHKPINNDCKIICGNCGKEMHGEVCAGLRKKDNQIWCAVCCKKDDENDTDGNESSDPDPDEHGKRRRSISGSDGERM